MKSSAPPRSMPSSPLRARSVSTFSGVIESPVKGAEGNVEYLMYAGNLADRAI